MNKYLDVERVDQLFAQGLDAGIIAKRLGATQSGVLKVLLKRHGTSQPSNRYVPVGTGLPGAASQSVPHFLEHSGDGSGSAQNYGSGFFATRERKP